MNSRTISAQNVASPRQKSDELSSSLSAMTDKSVDEKSFVWGVGIECSFIPHLSIDQFEWTQHDRFWKDDFKRAREGLGVSTIRYAFPWHKIEVRPGVFEWGMADERIHAADEMGLEIYLDVMHFGTPLWLQQAAGDPEFPEALERFTQAMVERFGKWIKKWSPCNEPLILSLFSGDFGFWPPHARKWTGYMPVLSRVVQATSRAMRAIRRADAGATIILCDNVEHFQSRDPELQQEIARRNLRRYLAMDLLLGRVDRHHPLFEWLVTYGFNELDLQWFATHPQSPDILGIDYYPNSEWQLEKSSRGIHQRRSETPRGLYGIARTYHQRYGLPMMLTETSADGKGINREIWLDQTIDDCRRLRSEGVPMLGYFWWPMIDQLDWDGALTHHIGKIHDVGIYNLQRQSDGTLARHPTALVEQFAKHVSAGTEAVGELAEELIPADEESGEPIGLQGETEGEGAAGPGHTASRPAASNVGVVRPPANARGRSPARSASRSSVAINESADAHESRATDAYGIVVFSHLRWGFVWQRPQQFLSRFARKHKILFVEEPIFDRAEGAQPHLSFHKVMPNVTVICGHLAPSWKTNPKLPALLRQFTQEGIDALNEDGDFQKPLLWYYSPMDSAWSLGYFSARGIVYDCMDELSHFTGAPPSLVANEARLMEHADVVFTGGYELGDKKKQLHPNVHTFGCGVDVAHFAKAADEATRVPPDIDFMKRPILGWFGVIDERVDYPLLAEIARARSEWSIAMVGPVVKVDPNLLPHAPNLFWLGGRDYQQLPNYCRAFDVCMMSFAINQSTKFINPTKGLEYMATGKPIVSTPVRDVVRQWSDIVRIANTPEEFVQACEEALRAGPQDPRVKKGLELAQKNSWDSTVAAMQKLIRDALASSRHSAAHTIEPLSETELEFSYTSTQGS